MAGYLVQIGKELCCMAGCQGKFLVLLTRDAILTLYPASPSFSTKLDQTYKLNCGPQLHILECQNI